MLIRDLFRVQISGMHLYPSLPDPDSGLQLKAIGLTNSLGDSYLEIVGNTVELLRILRPRT